MNWLNICGLLIGLISLWPLLGSNIIVTKKGVFLVEKEKCATKKDVCDAYKGECK